MGDVSTPSPSRKLVLCTASPGSGRDEYLDSVLTMATGKCVQLERLRVFDYIQQVGKAEGFEITKQRVLDLYLHNRDKMNEFRDAALQQIARKTEQSKSPCIVSTPSVFEWKGASMFGFEKQHVELLKPESIAIIVDDLIRIKERLLKDPQWKDKDFTLQMIAKWRRSGIDHVWELAHDFKPPIPVYIIAVEHDPDVLYDLLFSQKKKVYLSFPITGKGTAGLSKVFKFANRISNHLIVFNPLTIYDWNLVREWKSIVDKADINGKGIPKKLKCTIPYNRSGPRVWSCSSEEIRSIVIDARHQIVDRDYKMIDSSDCVVVHHKRKDISAGVMCEMVHANRANKEVYAYYPFEPSPWFEYYATQTDRDEEHFLQRLMSL